MEIRDKLYIDGAWVVPVRTDTIEILDPTTEEVIGRVPSGTAEDAERAIRAARGAFDQWARTPPSERAKYASQTAEALGGRMTEISDLIAREVGTPVNVSTIIQVGLPIITFSSMAELVGQIPWEETIGNSMVVREPVGVVGAITPWNYPLHQIAAKVAPALVAGCTVVLKPSGVAPLNAFVLAEVMHEIGLPPGVFNLVSGTGPEVGEAIARHRAVDMVSFTGSTRAGRRVAELAAATVKRVTLGARRQVRDRDPAGRGFRSCRAGGGHDALLNSGQTCNALTRMIVPRARLAEAEEIAALTAESYTPGNPFDDTTTYRPTRLRSSTRTCARLYPKRDRRGCEAGHRRGRPAGRPGEGFLRAPHGVLGGPTRHDDRPGRDIRAGSLDPPLRHRRRGNRDRE